MVVALTIIAVMIATVVIVAVVTIMNDITKGDSEKSNSCPVAMILSRNSFEIGQSTGGCVMNLVISARSSMSRSRRLCSPSCIFMTSASSPSSKELSSKLSPAAARSDACVRVSSQLQQNIRMDFGLP